MSATGPIADLSYRNYDGPKGVSAKRWWVIARNGIRITLKKRAFWVLLLFCASPYLLLMFFTFLQSAGGGRAPQQMQQFFDFPALLAGNYNRGFGLLLLALFIGAGAIAADNRANALQVYLSKPITKRDYLLGKWFYVFIVLFGAYFAPMFFATLYHAMANGIGSFLREEPLLFPKLIALSAIPAAVHASGVIGISAWNKTPWIVGVSYAGFLLFTDRLAAIFASTEVDSERMHETIKLLHIDGAITGIGQCIIGKLPRFFGETFGPTVLPHWQPLAAILLAVVVIGYLMARARIRAVEVVQG